jgi:antitoxin component YwqK of YwqJK toxin-antitoxin module
MLTVKPPCPQCQHFLAGIEFLKKTVMREAQMVIDEYEAEDELEFDGDILLYRGTPFTGTAQTTYPDGTLRSQRPYVEGFAEGVCREWHSNGQLSRDWLAVRGRTNGKKCEWHPNGTVKSIGYFCRGAELAYDEWDAEGTHIIERRLDPQSSLYKYAMKRDE